GCRLRKCSTTGTAAAAAPNRNRGERNDNITRSQRPRARRQVRHQGQFQWLPGAEELIVDAGRSEVAAVALDERAHGLEVMFANRGGYGHDFLVALEVFEPRRALERKIDLVRIEHLKHDHVVAAELKV